MERGGAELPARQQSILHALAARERALPADAPATRVLVQQELARVVAAALAEDLGRALLQVDLAGFASKSIGETEKHLARLLAEAARSGSVLLFDEADALFGRRTAVKDAHDRYANLEVSALHEALDRHRGLVCLAVRAPEDLSAALRRRFDSEVTAASQRDRAADEG